MGALLPNALVDGPVDAPKGLPPKALPPAAGAPNADVPELLAPKGLDEPKALPLPPACPNADGVDVGAACDCERTNATASSRLLRTFA